jgi:hypothetical protein
MLRTPWIGLVAIISMFVIPYIPAWLFEGPRTVKHRPRRHVCADCNTPWTAGHTCLPAADVLRPLRGELRRMQSPGRYGPDAGTGLSPRRDVVRRGQLARRGSSM